jgi:hypothetical protein
MDKSKTLEVLEQDFWPSPEFQSHLVTTCHRLRKVPLEKLSAENLRMLIGQKIGLQFIVPIALDKLEENLLASGDMYEGDLLSSLASLSSEFWDANEELKARAFELSYTIDSCLETLSEARSNFKERLSW